MRLRLSVSVLASLVVIAVLGATAASAARLPGSSHGGRPLSAALSGENEVPPADTPATGSARVTVNHGQAEVCWHYTFDDLTAPATAAHIHRGEAGVNGVVEVNTPPPAVTSGEAMGCATVDRALAREIKDDPAGFYLNVHTSNFPGGEIRGQLRR